MNFKLLYTFKNYSTISYNVINCNIYNSSNNYRFYIDPNKIFIIYTHPQAFIKIQALRNLCLHYM